MVKDGESWIKLKLHQAQLLKTANTDVQDLKHHLMTAVMWITVRIHTHFHKQELSNSCITLLLQAPRHPH